MEIPGRSIYNLEQSILKIFKFSIGPSWRLHDYRAGPDNVLVFVFSEKKMVQSVAIKQGRLANCKHLYFFFGLSGSYNQSFSFIQHRRPYCVIGRLFLTMTGVASDS